MKNICFLIGGFEGKGGIGRVTSTIINSFSKNDGYNFFTVSFLKEKKYGYIVNEDVKKEFLFTEETSMAKAILFKHAIKKLNRIIKTNQIDLIIACGVLYYPLAYYASKGTKAKSVFVEHTSPEIGHDFRLQRFIRYLSSKKAERIVLISKEASDWYIKKGIPSDRIELIYNAIPQSNYISKKYDSNSKKILSVGRLSYQKNFEGLIDVAKNFIAKYPDWTWDIWGTGEYWEMLEKKIKEQKLENQLFLKGNNDNMIAEYNKYAFIVMTSRYEGFPMTLIEAAANKLPMISYNIKTGPKEIINNALNGYLIEFEDKETMSKHIEELINNQDLRCFMSENAYKASLSFSIDAIKEKWIDLFRRLTME